jgi:hypothetical protein
MKKPMGWWYHKILAEISYKISCYEGNITSWFLRKYYFHLNKMCDEYKIDLYGREIEHDDKAIQNNSNT